MGKIQLFMVSIEVYDKEDYKGNYELDAFSL